MNAKGKAFTRRQFITASAAVGAMGVGFGLLSSKDSHIATEISKKGFVFGPGKGVQKEEKVFFLTAVDLNLAKPKVAHIPMNFFGHGLSFHPVKKNLVSIFEKKGPGACELNLQTGEIRTIETDPRRYFYGHGVYVFDTKDTTSGLKLLSTETVLATGEGVIVIRDAETLKIEGQFPSYGSNPHDCLLIENGTVLAITNGGASVGKNPVPSVTYVDVQSQKLLETFEVKDGRFNAGHLAVSKDKDIAMVSAPRLGLPESDLGAISFLSSATDKKLITLSEPKDIVSRLASETLSVCMDEARGVFVATSPAGDLLSFWKIKTGEFVSSIEIPRPRGVVMSRDKKHFLVSYNDNSSLAFVNAETLTLQPELEVKGAGFTGSHLYLV